MGAVFARDRFGVANPRVALLSIGEEAGKGNEFVKEVFELMKAVDWEGTCQSTFIGNAEGRDIMADVADVVVTDGFTGNIVLKTSEAIAGAIFTWLKSEICKTPARKLGGFLARPAFKAIHKKTSSDEYGGMPLLGVNGVCIIAHGGSSAVAVKNAIRMAASAVRQQVNPHIIEEVQRYHEAATHVQTSA